jgi:plasmid stabilization system protein ParE
MRADLSAKFSKRCERNMTYQIKFEPGAKEDLENAFLWILERSPAHAQPWRDRLEETLTTLKHNPQRCTLAPKMRILTKTFDNCYTGNVAVLIEYFSPSEGIPFIFCIFVMVPGSIWEKQGEIYDSDTNNYPFSHF